MNNRVCSRSVSSCASGIAGRVVEDVVGPADRSVHVQRTRTVGIAVRVQRQVAVDVDIELRQLTAVKRIRES